MIDDVIARAASYCHLYSEADVARYVAGDLLTALAYVLIPAAVAYVLRRQRRALHRVDRAALILCALFVVACGAGHALDAARYLLPPSAASTVATVDSYWRLATAAISLATTWHLLHHRARFARFASPERLRDALQAAEVMRAAAEAREEQLTRLTSQLPGVAWEMDTDWVVTASVGVGLSRFGLAPHALVGTDAREWLTEAEVALYRRILAGVSDHEEYTNRITPETHPAATMAHGTSWSVSLRVILSAKRGEAGEIIGVSVYAIEITEGMRREARRDVLAEADRELAAFFRGRRRG